MQFFKDTYVRWLGVIFLGIFIGLGVDPHNRFDWYLEHILTAMAIGFLMLTHTRIGFSRLSCSMIFLYLALHTFGAHYTYSNVPYREVVSAFTGESMSELDMTRNHYDRLIHLSYGLLLSLPLLELLYRWVGLRGVWLFIVPVEIIMSTSMVYELMEWGIAEVFGGEVGSAYNGTQGDEWDAQKDMALASLGALIVMSLTGVLKTYVLPLVRMPLLRNRNFRIATGRMRPALR